MSNAPRDRKISQFLVQPSVQATDVFTFVRQGTNFQTPFSSILSSLGVTGTISSLGQGIPVLNQPAAGVNQIRTIDDGIGTVATIDPDNGIKIDTELNSVGEGVPVLINETTTPQFRTLTGLAPINVAAAGNIIQISSTDAPVPTNTIIVNSLSDLPPPNGLNKITLASGSSYVISSPIDVSPNSIVFSEGTTLSSSGVFANTLTSDTVNPMFESPGGIRAALVEISVTCPNAPLLDVSSPTPKTGLFTIDRIFIFNCASLGNINNVAFSLVNFIALNVAGNGFTFSGSIDFCNITSDVVEGFTGTLIDLGTAVFDILTISAATVVSANPANVIIDGLPNSGNISALGHGSFRDVSILGPFTNTPNILNTDTRWYFFNNIGIPNSYNFAQVSMPVNATATTIAAVNTPVKAAGVWTTQSDSRFAGDVTGRITYSGQNALNTSIVLTCTVEKQGAGTSDVRVQIFKNGSLLTGAIAENDTDANDQSTYAINFIDPVLTVPTDFYEVYLENLTDADDLRLFAASFSCRGFE